VRRKKTSLPPMPRIGRLLVVLMIIAFFAGGLIGHGFAPPQIAWLTEIIILAMFVETARRCRKEHKRMALVGQWYAAAIIAISTLAWLRSDLSFVSMLLFLRKVLRFYLLLIILINSNIDDLFMKRANNLMTWLFIIQIPTAVIKLFIYGQGEHAIGTYAEGSGGNSTVIPMIAVSFLLPYHYMYRKRLATFALGLGFLAFGIIGGKRGIVVLVPLVVLLSAMCMRWNMGRKMLGRRSFAVVFAVIAGGLLAFYATCRAVPRLNPDRRVWGRFSASFAVQVLSERLETEQEGGASHRISATVTAWRHIYKRGAGTVLLGRGPGSIMLSIFQSYDKRFAGTADGLKIRYGITGLSWLLLQTGVLGAAVWLGFFIYALTLVSRAGRREGDPYWRAFHVGMMGFTLVTLVVSCVYNTSLLIGDCVAFVYMVLLAFSIKRCNLSIEAARAAEG